MKNLKLFLSILLLITGFDVKCQDIGDIKILTPEQVNQRELIEQEKKKIAEEKKLQLEREEQVKRAEYAKEAKFIVSYGSKFGFKIGYNNVGFSKEIYKRLADSFFPFKGDSPSGYTAGLVLYPGRNFPLKIEVNYSTLGKNYSNLEDPSDFVYRQFNFNALYNLIAKKGFYGEFGAGFDFTNNFRIDDRFEIDEKLSGFSGLVGVGHRIANKIDLNFRYRTTLSNKSNNGDDIEPMKGINISVGILF